MRTMGSREARLGGARRWKTREALVEEERSEEGMVWSLFIDVEIHCMLGTISAGVGAGLNASLCAILERSPIRAFVSRLR